MNKNELITTIATKTGYSKKDITAVFEATIDSIIEAVANDNAVNIVGFGKFDVTNRAERTGVNPSTGESIVIPACKTPKFKAGSVFKQALK